MTRAERDRLLVAARGLGPVPYAAIRTTVECGNRATETAHMRVGDVDWDSGIVKVLRLKHSAAVMVEVSQELVTVLRGVLAPNAKAEDLIFTGTSCCEKRYRCECNGGHVSRRTLYYWLDEAGKRAGLPATIRRFHTLKHTGACDYGRDLNGLPAGAQLRALQEFTGHKRVETLTRYMQDPEVMAEAQGRRRKSLKNLP